MATVVGQLIGGLIGMTIGALMISAPILRWQARLSKSWEIKYKDACLVALKASYISFLLANAIVFSFAISGVVEKKESLSSVGIISGLIIWWLIHSNALIKIADASVPLSIKEARGISGRVLGLLLLIPFLLSVSIVVIVELIK